jgi:alkanesulfonate monooxygenase SsuD/methylene tetrahydromethanopterin reductase-like flavin-dependent oxidoreductase (luciferase family)
MDVGIGLPSTIPAAGAATVLEWARRADSASFSSVSVLDRIVYTNYEPLIALAAASPVTQHVRLMTSVLLAPLRNAVLLAKQAASVDALSGGRLTLGLGAGLRDDDFQVVGVDFHTRGRRFDEQLATMKRVWSGESLARGAGPIGPRPARAGATGTSPAEWIRPKPASSTTWPTRVGGRRAGPESRASCVLHTSRSAPMPRRASAPTSATITRSWVPRSAT